MEDRFIFILFLCTILSCKNPQKSLTPQSQPDGRAYGAVIDVWEKGRHSFTLEADSLVVFGDTAKLWKISLLIYQNGENFAKLIACSAYSYKDSDFVALGKVNLAYKDTVLYTDRLFYKKSSEKIYAPKVTIRTPNTITRGKNFVTDAGFRNFKLHEVFMDVKERR